ncbi:MAG: hypothetical protein K9H16_04485 [Bacteroidales bacterium]|nr:hypothetical protein [Bacteroidales bacterium]
MKIFSKLVFLVTLILFIGNSGYCQFDGFWHSQSGDYFQLSLTHSGFRYHNSALCPTARSINQIVVDGFGFNGYNQKLYKADFGDYGVLAMSVIFTVINATSMRLDVTYFDAYRRVTGTNVMFWTYYGNTRPLRLPPSCNVM